MSTNKWVEAAKLVLRGEYPTAQFDFVDEWPTLEAPATLFSPRRVILRADIGIVKTAAASPADRRAPTGPRAVARCTLDQLVAVVEVGDLSHTRKFEQWTAALPPGVRLIWMPKLDLFEMLWPEANRYRYRPGPYARAAMLEAVDHELERWSRLQIAQERMAKTIQAHAQAARGVLREATKALEMCGHAFGAVHERMRLTHDDLTHILEFNEALTHTSGVRINERQAEALDRQDHDDDHAHDDDTGVA